MAAAPGTPLPNCCPRCNPCQPYAPPLAPAPAPAAASRPPPRPSPPPPPAPAFLPCAPAAPQEQRLPEKKTCPLDDILADLRRPVSVPPECTCLQAKEPQCTCPINWTLTVEYPNQTVLCTSARKPIHPLCTCAQPHGQTARLPSLPEHASLEATCPSPPHNANALQQCAANFTGSAVPSPRMPTWPCEQAKPNAPQRPCTDAMQNPCPPPQMACTNAMQNPELQRAYANAMQNPCPQPQRAATTMMQRPGTNAMENSCSQLQSQSHQAQNNSFQPNAMNNPQDMRQQSRLQESVQPYAFSPSQCPMYFQHSTSSPPIHLPPNARHEIKNSFHQLQSSCSLPNWFENAPLNPHAGTKCPVHPLQATCSLCNFPSHNQQFPMAQGKWQQNPYPQSQPEQGECQPTKCPVHGTLSPCTCPKDEVSPTCPVHGGQRTAQAYATPSAPPQASNPGAQALPPCAQQTCPVHGRCRQVFKQPQAQMAGGAPPPSPAPVPAPALACNQQPCAPCPPPRPKTYTPPSIPMPMPTPTACPPGCPAYPLWFGLQRNNNSPLRALSQVSAPPGSAPPGGGAGAGDGERGGPAAGAGAAERAARGKDGPGGEDDTVAAALGRGSWVQDEWRPKTRVGPRVASREGKRPVSRNAADYFKPLHILRGGQLLSDVDCYRLNGIQDSCKMKIRRLH